MTGLIVLLSVLLQKKTLLSVRGKKEVDEPLLHFFKNLNGMKP
jgi:hypothetical protein